jgi:peroxiredoxin
MNALVCQTLPSTELPSTCGGTVNPAQVQGVAVIFCYPWTGRPGVPNPPNWDHIPGAHGSTPQAQAYAELHPNFVASGAQVFGLSFQDSEWQKEFAARNALPFPLLSDQKREFSIALHLETFSAGQDSYLKRITLVSENGKVIAVRSTIPDPQADANETLAIVGRLNRA